MPKGYRGVRIICRVEGCMKGVTADGVCQRHLYLRTDKICKKEGCNAGVYAKGMCRNCFSRTERALKTGKIASTLCSRQGCSTMSMGRICSVHLNEQIKKLRPEVGYKHGKKHHSWKGGVSDYPQHSTMKRQRKRKIEEHNGCCEDCGKSPKIIHVHHRDGSKDNHDYGNLILVCPKCHINNHHPELCGAGVRGPGKGRTEYTSQYKRILKKKGVL